MIYFLLHLWRKLWAHMLLLLYETKRNPKMIKSLQERKPYKICIHISINTYYVVDNLKEIDTKLLNNSHCFFLFMDKHNIIITIGVSA